MAPTEKNDKRPRHYAADILALAPTEREAAITGVPEHMRDAVRHHVQDQAQKIDALANHVSRLDTKEARKKAVEKIPEGVREAVKMRVIELFTNRRAQ